MNPYLTLGIALIALGFLLMAAELFVGTGFVAFSVGLACIALGTALSFFVDLPTGLCTMLAVFVLLPLATLGGLWLWPRTPAGRQLMLTDTAGDATVEVLPGNKDLESFRGRVGRSLSYLRPAGAVDFDGRRVDCITEGMMVPPDTPVRCVDVREGKVIVRPLQSPNISDLETAQFN